MNAEQIARVCHEANRALCELQNDTSQKPWDQAEPWQRESAIAGVKFRLDNPDALESAQHEAWVEHKTKEGWTHGPVKDPAKKEHPCMVPYNELPAGQKTKDILFKAIVLALDNRV